MAVLLRLLIVTIGVWMVFKWISRFFFGSRRSEEARPNRNPGGSAKKRRMNKKPDLDKIGEYIEFEEVD